VVPERIDHWGFHVKLRHALSAATAGLALAGASFFLSPASAVGPVTGSSPVSLVVSASGGLAVTAPQPPVGSSAIDLGTFTAGSIAAPTNSLGTITVTDTRTGILNNNWVGSVSASDLVLDGLPANATAPGKFIPAASLGYTTGSVTSVVAPTVPPVVVPTLASLAVSAPIVTNVSLGPNTLSWNPSLTVTILPNTLPGTYMGTVTHSIL
jgi:hypothetical protein